jgi:predicted nucleic acid-binding protein
VALTLLLDSGVANLVALHRSDAVARVSVAGRVYVPDIALGELYYGAYIYAHAHASAKYLDIYDAFYQQFRDRVLHPNDDTFRVYAAISAELKTKGAPIQHNDMWIAALARQYGLTLATLDSDFTRVSGLQVELW